MKITIFGRKVIFEFAWLYADNLFILRAHPCDTRRTVSLFLFTGFLAIEVTIATIVVFPTVMFKKYIQKLCMSGSKYIGLTTWIYQ